MTDINWFFCIPVHIWPLNLFLVKDVLFRIRHTWMVFMKLCVRVCVLQRLMMTLFHNTGSCKPRRPPTLLQVYFQSFLKKRFHLFFKSGILCKVRILKSQSGPCNDTPFPDPISRLRDLCFTPYKPKPYPGKKQMHKMMFPSISTLRSARKHGIGRIRAGQNIL